MVCEVDIKYKRWLLPVLVGFLLFANHYTRDSLGALEKQFESELHLTDQDYSNLNALYFFPNIITPLLAGMLTEKMGGVSNCFLYSVVIASCGHLIFTLGIQFSSKGLIFLGRALGGTMYEIIDALMPITYLGPLFESEFPMVVGFLQIFIRMGSVANFIISPYLYLQYNLSVAFWVAAIVGMSSVPLFLYARVIEFEFLDYQREQKKLTTNGTDDDYAADGGDGEQGVELIDHNKVVSCSGVSGDNVGSSSGSCGAVSRGGFVILGDEEEDDWEEPVETAIGSSTKGSIEDISGIGGQSPTSIVVDALHSHNNSHEVRHRSMDSNKSATTTITSDSTDVYLSSSKSDSENNSDSDSSRGKSTTSIASQFLEIMPLHLFSLQFYLYLLAGSFLYGSIVPFWFTGSKYMQDWLYLSVSQADTLMTIPEGLVIVVCFPLGILVSRYKWSLRVKLTGMFFAMMGMSASYLILVASTVYGEVSGGNSDSSAGGDSSMSTSPPTYSLFLPVIAVTLLGVSFAVSSSFYWGSIAEIVAGDLLSPGTGLVSCAVNVLPAVVPPIMACFVDNSVKTSHVNMYALSIMASLSAVLCISAANPTVIERLAGAVQSVLHNCSCVTVCGLQESSGSGHSAHSQLRTIALRNKNMSVSSNSSTSDRIIDSNGRYDVLPTDNTDDIV